MSHNEILLIDSKYRNRNKHENPYSFSIESRNRTFFDKKTAGDPVSIQAPIISWSPDDLIITGTVIETFSSTTILVKTTDYVWDKINFYTGLNVSYESGTTIGVYISNMITESRLRYSSLGDFFIELKLKDDNRSFSNRIEKGFTINFLSLTSITDNYMFIPSRNILCNISHGEYIITNDTLGPVDNNAIINYYNDINNVAYISGNLSSWLPSHSYSLRIEKPYGYESVGLSITDVLFNNSKDEFNITSSIVDISSLYDYGRFLTCSVSSVDNENKYTNIEQIYLFIELISGSVLVGDEIKDSEGNNIKILSEAKKLNPLILGTMYKVVLQSGVISKGVPMDMINLTTQTNVNIKAYHIIVRISDKLPVIPQPGDTFEVLEISIDNEGSIQKNNLLKVYDDDGKNIKQNKKIRLLELLIPNTSSRYISSIFEHRYLYIKLYNKHFQKAKQIITNSSVKNNMNMSFEVPLSDKYCTKSDRFIIFDKLPSIDIDSKIDLTTDIYFEICLPDGSIYSSEQEDSMPPNYPICNLQVAAKFMIIY